MRIKILALGVVCLLVSCTTANLIKNRKNYISLHIELTPAIRNAISGGEVLIGMTTEQVLASRGRPLDINKSTGKWGIHEQWVYVRVEANPRMQMSRREALLDHKYGYIYFENGKVTSWQSR